MTASFDQVDGLLLMGFGGPEAPEEVVPFLENVTRGAGIPAERLEEVGQHYFLFGGKSPINDQAKELMRALHDELDARGHDLPIFWGNKNWHPLLPEMVQAAKDSGGRRFLVMTISAYPSYSGCRSYREAMAEAAEGSGLDFIRIGHYALDDGFVTANTEAVADALAAAGPGARLVFVTHSIPVAMNESSGQVEAKGAYLAWHQQVASEICRRLDVADHDLVFCSRSGPPHQPWLEPDVNDHLADLAAQGVTKVVLSPIGFISDHMEVIYDLDTQARETCDQLGIEMHRAATAGTHRAFVRGLADRIERVGALGLAPAGCGGPDCCPNLRAPGRPAID